MYGPEKDVPRVDGYRLYRNIVGETVLKSLIPKVNVLMSSEHFFTQPSPAKQKMIEQSKTKLAQRVEEIKAPSG